MLITNNYNLPTAILRAARRDTYSRGDSRISITQLITSPRINALRDIHHDKLTADITDRIWALLGTAVHHILEAGADEDHITEERLFADVAGWRVSGGLDVQKFEDGFQGILDYKVTSVWSVIYDKPEWEYQLNSYAFLARRNGRVVDKLQICAILRDWRKSDADRNADYPQRPIVLVDIQLWDETEAEAYVTGRVVAHQEARAAVDLDEDLPLCTDEDRWMREAKWAVFKKNQKRAMKVLDTEAEASSMATEIGGTVEKRGGEPKRCQGNYCGVAEWCEQYQQELRS